MMNRTKRDAGPVHVASLNLFLEPDGKLYVTVQGLSSVELVRRLAADHGLPDGTPADQLDGLIKLAENVKS